MRIQFLNGGLANQAFQYIFARYYELSHPGQLMYLDDSYFALHTVHNGYELEKVFGIHPHMLSECFDEDVWEYILMQRRGGKSIPTVLCENELDFYIVSEVKDSVQTFNPFSGKVVWVAYQKFQPEILDFPDNVYYHGYWIQRDWFAQYKNIFQKEFHFPEIDDSVNREHLNRIRETNSCSIHIRRGDYVKLGLARNIVEYRKYINFFLERSPLQWNLFVFSDDIPWCREHEKDLGFSQFADVTYVEGNTEGRNYIDMQLMSQCKGMILSNSAFCYLAALLNTNRQCWVNPTARAL